MAPSSWITNYTKRWIETILYKSLFNLFIVATSRFYDEEIDDGIGDEPSEDEIDNSEIPAKGGMFEHYFISNLFCKLRPQDF